MNLRNKTIKTRRCAWCDTVDNYHCQNVPGNYKRVPRGEQGYLTDPFGEEEKITLYSTCFQTYQRTMDEYLIYDLEKEFAKDENQSVETNE